MQTLSSSTVAVARSSHVDVVVAHALLANSARLIRVSVVVVVAHVALRSSIARLTVADDVIAAGDQGALCGVRVTRSDGVRAAARSAANFTSKQGFAVESFEAAVAVPAHCEVLTLVALSGLGVAGGSVAVAVAGLTVWEVPVASLALIALASVGFRMAIALASHKIALVVL